MQICIYINLATYLESEMVKTFLVLAQTGSHENCPNFWVNSPALIQELW